MLTMDTQYASRNTQYGIRYTQYAPRNTQYPSRNTQYATRDTLHASRNRPLHLSRELYKSHLFMQNKAKLKNDEMNVTTSKTKEYENLLTFCRCENKAKQSQFKPNFGLKLGLFFPILAFFVFSSKTGASFFKNPHKTPYLKKIHLPKWTEAGKILPASIRGGNSIIV